MTKEIITRNLCVNEQEIFVRNLKNLMLKNNINQYELAEKINMKQPSVSVVMRGENNPSFKFMALVCELFNVSFKEMFTPSEEQFGEQLEKDEEILELKQEIIRRNTQIDELNKKLASVTPIEVPVDNKVKVLMEDDGTDITINGKGVDFVCVEKVDIFNKTIEVVLKFDELSVK